LVLTKSERTRKERAKMVISGAELVGKATQELEQLLAEEKESLAVLNGVRGERIRQILEHEERIRALQDANLGGSPRRAEVETNIFTIQALLKIRAAS
jgi:hypothetical protein